MNNERLFHRGNGLVNSKYKARDLASAANCLWQETSCMDLKIKSIQSRPVRRSAFTFVEALVAMGITGLLVLALYSGMTSATFSIRLARENLRATEIMVGKMEGLRLFTWDQINDPTYVPTNFTAPYYDDGTTNNANSGIIYTGSLTIGSPPTVNCNYSNDLRVVTITLNWTSGSLERTRTLDTYVGRYGIQNYIIQH